MRYCLTVARYRSTSSLAVIWWQRAPLRATSSSHPIGISSSSRPPNCTTVNALLFNRCTIPVHVFIGSNLVATRPVARDQFITSDRNKFVIQAAQLYDGECVTV